MGRKSIVKDITYGVCGTLVDVLIWQIALVGASFGKSGPRGVHQAFQEADEFLNTVNHKTLAATWHQLTKKRLISYKRRDNLYSPLITEFGKKRLNEKIPQYHKNRPWDKKIYLITYDIPEKANWKRDIFRKYLHNIKCQLLQESTWLTPYNPRQLVSNFVKEYKIPGTVIVSDVGQDGGIGEMTVQDLMVKFFFLENLNDKYEEFINDAKDKSIPIKNLLFRYLSILKNDPQLPFELLPQGWLGEKAFLTYEKLKEKYILFYSRLLPK